MSQKRRNDMAKAPKEKADKAAEVKPEKAPTEAKPEAEKSTASTDVKADGQGEKVRQKPRDGKPRAKVPYVRRVGRQEAHKLVDLTKRHTVEEAVELAKKTAFAKFDETIDLAVRLGVNPKHADQMVRGALVLPYGTGQTLRVVVFAKGEKATEAKNAGADEVGADDLAKRVQEGYLDFDRVIATPDMMGVVGKLGRILGPRGLMPNPKVGTVTFDVTEGGQDRVPRREGWHRPRPHRQAVLRGEGPGGQRHGPHPGAGPCQAVHGQGHLPAQHHGQLDHGPWHQGRPALDLFQERGGLIHGQVAEDRRDRRAPQPLRPHGVRRVRRLQGPQRRRRHQAAR
jgi:hypothetical protein